jgi:hypothetical protein
MKTTTIDENKVAASRCKKAGSSAETKEQQYQILEFFRQ